MFELGGEGLSFALHGGGDSGGIAGTVSEVLTFIEKLTTLSPERIFAELMPGISVLENLHPLFVHFPIALLTLFFIFELVSLIASQAKLRSTASHFLYLGTLSSAMTVTAGLIAAGTLPHGDDVHEIMEHHEHLGISVLLVCVALSIWRFLSKEAFEGPVSVLFSFSSVILMALLALTADLGGFMVYGHGVAVVPVMATQSDAVENHQHSDNLEQNQPAAKDHESISARVSTPNNESQSLSIEAPIQSGTVKKHVHADGHKHTHAH